jgi:hypothetical protein
MKGHRADSQDQNKMMNEMSKILSDRQAQIKLNVESLNSLQTFQTEVKNLRNVFVSSQNGQTEAAESALSIHLMGCTACLRRLDTDRLGPPLASSESSPWPSDGS